MSSIFTKIIIGEIPCHKITENDHCIAFMDINPLVKGHVLCIPKKEIDQYFDLSNDDLVNLTLFSKKVAIALKKTIPCERIAVSVIGLEVPHAHVHLLPINTVQETNFERPKLQIDHEELAKIAQAIKANL